METRSSVSSPAPESPVDGKDSNIFRPGGRIPRKADPFTGIAWSEYLAGIQPVRPVVDMKWDRLAIAPGGSGVALHQHHKDHAIWYVLSGKGSADVGPTMGARQFDVGPGDLIDAPIGGYHYVENTGEDELVILQVIMRSADWTYEGPLINPVEMTSFDQERYGAGRARGRLG